MVYGVTYINSRNLAERGGFEPPVRVAGPRFAGGLHHFYTSMVVRGDEIGHIG